MQPLEVVSRPTPSLGFGNDVIDLPLVSVPQVPSTFPALPVLLLQECGDSRGYVWMASYSSAPVDPVSVVWTACALDFHMSLDGGVRVAGEGYLAVGCLEGPPFPIVHSPVLARDPVFLLVWVAGDCPSSQHRVNGVVKGLKDPCTGNMRVVIAPAHHLRVQRLHQRLLSGVLMAVNRLTQFCHMSSDGRLAGFDERFETLQVSSAICPRRGFPRGVLSDVKAEELESRGFLCTYEGVGETRLAGFQSESSVLQPRCRHFLTWHDDLAILVQNHPVIGRDHDFGCLKASAPTPRTLLAKNRFETVQGNVGHQRCTVSSLPRPFVRGEPLARIGHPRLPPSFQWAAEAWARVDLFASGGMINPVKAFFKVGV
jgi:hypothetical protein